jgi:hypothetical protein
MADAGDLEELPLKIRDMIYDQPLQTQLLDHEISLRGNSDLSGYCNPPQYAAVTRPCSSLFLVNKKISSEYKRRCERRQSTLIVADRLWRLTTDDEDDYEITIARAVLEKVSAVHLHAYHPLINFSECERDEALIWDNFEAWLLASSSSTLAPRSLSLAIVVELRGEDVQSEEDQQYILRKLNKLIVVEQLRELKIVVPDGKGGSPPTKLLPVDWKRGNANPSLLVGPMVKFEQKCCAVVSGGRLSFECRRKCTSRRRSSHKRVDTG